MWHLRLGHLNLKSLRQLHRLRHIAVSIDDSEAITRCEDCIRGKSSRINMASREHHRVARKLNRVHSDLCQLPCKSRQGSRYMMTFVDEFTHRAVVYFLKYKHEAFKCFKHYVNYAERETQEQLKCIHTDNGGEYSSNEWKALCEETGIKHSMGPPHSPQLNGVAESYNRTLLDRILPSLLHANLSTKFWEDAAHHALTSLNLSPTQANESQTAPEFLWKNKPMSYTRLRPFGCKVYRLVTGPAGRGKLSSKTSDALHLYTLPDGDGYMVWDSLINRAVKTHDAVHHEDTFPGLGETSKKTISKWMTWSTATVTPLPMLSRTSLYGRRLSAPIHNPNNPVNRQANRIPLPPQDDEELEDLTSPPATPVKNPAPFTHSPSPDQTSTTCFPTPPLRRGTRARQAPT